MLDNNSNRIDTIDFKNYTKTKNEVQKLGDVRDYLPPAPSNDNVMGR